MQQSARRRPGRSFLVRAMLSLSLVGAIGLGLASDAAAIDPPTHPRKAAKHGPLSKGKAAVGRTALPKGGAAPSQGAGPRDGAARLHDRAAPGTGLSKSSRPGADRHQPAALAKRSATVPGVGQRGALSKSLTPAQRRLRIDHRRSILIARSRLPHRPFPGERGFTGVPPAGETRFVSNEMVFQVGANVSQQAIDNAARRLGLTTVGSQSFGLTGGTLFHFRVAQGRAGRRRRARIGGGEHRRCPAELCVQAAAGYQLGGTHAGRDPTNTSSTSCGWATFIAWRPDAMCW